MLTLLLIQVVATIFMTGLIYFVQVVHYPLFNMVGQNFAPYEAAHQRLTSYVVMPPMLAELAVAALLLWFVPSGVDQRLPWSGFALVVLIWVSTFLLQVPQHEALGRGFSDAAHNRLIGTNWIRTVAWTLRSGIVLAMLVQYLGREQG